MTRYKEALEVIKQATTFGIEQSLAGMTTLVKKLGDPQLAYPCVQIAGTNGKSSTTRFIAAFLRSQGLRVGLYTSPELVEYPERIEIDGAVVSKERFAEAVLEANRVAKEAIAAGEIALATEFELITAAAFWLFAQERVDYAVLEAGMGGRWDATSVMSPRVALITGVGLDHIDILGDTVEKIAAEKAAIIKPGSLAILGPGTAETRDVFEARCREVGVEAPLVVDPAAVLDTLGLDMGRFPGYQKQNIACALVATQAVLGDEALDWDAIQQVLDTLSIPGRFELLRREPPLLIDASHNPQSSEVLAQSLVESQGLDEGSGHIKGYDTLLLGVLADKDADGIIKALAGLFDTVVVTQTTSPRAIPVGELAHRVARLTGGEPEAFDTVALALEALSTRGAAVVATGSITLAGEVKGIFTGQL